MTKIHRSMGSDVEGDLHLKSYRYSLFSYGKLRETVDIYSKAVTRNSSRSVVTDPARTVFDEWEMDADH
jgi:pullulanase